MNPEFKDILKTLKMAQYQIQGAIVLIENNCVAAAPSYRVIRTSPNTIEVGDFVITDKFIEPKATSER